MFLRIFLFIINFYQKEIIHFSDSLVRVTNIPPHDDSKSKLKIMNFSMHVREEKLFEISSSYAFLKSLQVYQS